MSLKNKTDQNFRLVAHQVVQLSSARGNLRHDGGGSPPTFCMIIHYPRLHMPVKKNWGGCIMQENKTCWHGLSSPGDELRTWYPIWRGISCCFTVCSNSFTLNMGQEQLRQNLFSYTYICWFCALLLHITCIYLHIPDVSPFNSVFVHTWLRWQIGRELLFIF